MHSRLAHPSSHNQRHASGTADGGRRLSSARNYDSSGLGYLDSRGIPQQSEHHITPRSVANHGSFAPSAAVQSPYHIHAYMESPSFSHSDLPRSQMGDDDWDVKPFAAMAPGTPVGRVTYPGASTTSRSTTLSCNGHYGPPSGFSTYDQARAPVSPLFHPSPSPPEDYGGSYAGTPAPAYSANSGYSQSAPFGYGLPPVFRDNARPQKVATPRCEWDECRMIIDDASPAGIARHLRQHHNVQVTDNRSRTACLWGARACGKDMYPSSFGKHIAECHLRNMVKQCPHCGADFARADTLSRHIKAFCPNSSG